MDYIKTLQEIYDSEINYSISTFWDGGFNIKIGDETNGFEEEMDFYLIQDAVQWLSERVVILYPDSNYAIGVQSK